MGIYHGYYFQSIMASLGQSNSKSQLPKTLIIISFRLLYHQNGLA